MSERIDAFFSAIKQGDVAAVSRLLDESTVLLQAKDSSGHTPVLTAAYHRQPQVVDLLVERGAALNLYEACAAGQIERVQSLLAIDKAQVNGYAPDGFQPLGLAAFFGHSKLVELLLASGADVNTPSDNALRVYPINSAAAGGHIGIVQRLLSHGADPNTFQAEGFTPLHSAAQNGQPEMVRLLLSHGADPSIQAQGKTPADLAHEHGSQEVIALL